MHFHACLGLGMTVLFGNRLLTGDGRGALDMTSVFSLMGHLIYGAILGLTAVRVLKSRA